VRVDVFENESQQVVLGAGLKCGKARCLAGDRRCGLGAHRGRITAAIDKVSRHPYGMLFYGIAMQNARIRLMGAAMGGRPIFAVTTGAG
jgi:hypothetical protein